jgi:hypothetical protein
MITKERVLPIVQSRGPVIPNQIKQILNEGDTFIIGAVLSELATKGLIKISHTKRGGSPFYYVRGQEHRLENLKEWLNEKDQRTFELIKEEKVLRDYAQNPLIRVSLRNIKDFAKPIEVKLKDNTEVFWKWYQLSNEEALGLIKKKAGVQQIPKREPIKEEVKKEKPVLKTIDDTGTFYKTLKGYFDEKRIEVKEVIKKKKKDHELIISIPSAVGRVEYYCRAKDKKKCNDGDLSSAYLTAQSKKLQPIFITTGEVTKKAKEKLNNEFKGMILKEL